MRNRGWVFVKQAKRIEQIGTGVRVPIHVWVLNPDEEPGDACTNGVCPEGPVTVHDTGGHFEVAGYNTFNNIPAMRAIIPQDPTPIPLGDLKRNLERLLKTGDCEKYTQKLLAEAAKLFAGSYPHINTVMEGYGKISGPGGGGYVFKNEGYDTVSGDLFAHGASPGTVLLLQNGTFGTPTSKQVSFFQGMYTYKALHETFHLGTQGGYDDFQMASAAYSLAQKQLPTAPRNLTGLALAAYFSRKFDEELKKHCPYPQQ